LFGLIDAASHTWPRTATIIKNAVTVFMSSLMTTKSTPG
jgi:hypothetical protein